MLSISYKDQFARKNKKDQFNKKNESIQKRRKIVLFYIKRKPFPVQILKSIFFLQNKTFVILLKLLSKSLSNATFVYLQLIKQNDLRLHNSNKSANA